MDETIKNQQGISLIITFFILLIVLAVVLSLSSIMYSQVRIIRDSNRSVVALGLADSGIEKLLYYDRKVVPEGATHGICAMVADQNPTCPSDSYPDDPNKDHSIYCNKIKPNGIAMPKKEYISGPDCNLNTCTDCTVIFYTFLDIPPHNKYYMVTATVAPDFYLDAKSLGTYYASNRQLEVKMETNQ